jgi:hypothetical protein
MPDGAGRRNRRRRGCCPPAGCADRAADRTGAAARRFPRRPLPAAAADRRNPADPADPAGTALAGGLDAGSGLRGPEPRGPEPPEPGPPERPLPEPGPPGPERRGPAAQEPERRAAAARCARAPDARARAGPDAGLAAGRGLPDGDGRRPEPGTEGPNLRAAGATGRGRHRLPAPGAPGTGREWANHPAAACRLRGGHRSRRRWTSTHEACGPRGPQRSRTGTSRTRRDPATCSGPACY